MITATFDARGIDEAIAQLYSRITIGDLEDSLVEAVEPLRRDAQAALRQAAQGPYATGETAKAGVQTVVEHDSDGQPRVVVGMLKKKGRAHIGRWLEIGIPSRGIAARPWFRPAEDRHLPAIAGRFAAAMRKRLGA